MTHGDLIVIDSERWRVLSVGYSDPVSGKTMVHVAHLTNGSQCKNGFRPITSCGWWSPTTLTLSRNP